MMNKMMNWMMEEESGQGMVEYGLIIVLIALVVIGALRSVGGSLNNKFNQINTELNNVSGS